MTTTLSGPESIVIGSEFFLSLYPILIKLVPVGLPTQLVARFATFAGTAGVLATPAELSAVFGSPAALARTAIAGALTLAHVFTSYAAFASLSAGVSITLFYTYPFWNYLGAKFIFGEAVQGNSLPWLSIGLLGTFLVSSRGITDEVGGLVKAPPLSSTLGVAAALAAAITESAMYFLVKERDSVSASLLELYGGAAAWMLLAIPALGLKLSASPTDIAKMVGFNIAVGFVGYAARFFAVPRVKTEIFGLLSFAGVISAFLFGWLFVGERPSLWTLVGAALVIIAMSQIETLK